MSFDNFNYIYKSKSNDVSWFYWYTLSCITIFQMTQFKISEWFNSLAIVLIWQQFVVNVFFRYNRKKSNIDSLFIFGWKNVRRNKSEVGSAIYGNPSLSMITVRYWFNKFKHDRSSVFDEERPGCPTLSDWGNC